MPFSSRVSSARHTSATESHPPMQASKSGGSSVTISVCANATKPPAASSARTAGAQLRTPLAVDDDDELTLAVGVQDAMTVQPARCAVVVLEPEQRRRADLVAALVDAGRVAMTDDRLHADPAQVA